MLKDIFKNNGYEYVMNLLPGICVAVLVCFQLSFGVSNAVLLAAVSISILIMLLGLKNYQKPITYFAGAIILAVAAYILMENLDMSDYGIWLEGVFSVDEVEENRIYEVITIILVMLIFTVFSYFLQKMFFVKLVFSGVFLGYMAYLIFVELNINKLCVISMVVYILLTVMELVQRHSVKDLEKVRSMMTNLLPAVLVIYLLLLAFTYPKERYQWTFVKKTYKFFTEVVSDISALVNKEEEETVQSDYVISFIGYSGEGAVDAGHLSDKRTSVALFLQYQQDDFRPIYIKGNHSNYFNGETWVSTNNDIQAYREYELDTVEYLYAIMRSGLEEEVTQYVTEENALVNYNTIKTTAMFIPEKLLSIDLIDTSKYTLNYNTPMLLTTSSPDTSYRISYLRINTDMQDELIKLNENYKYSKDKTYYYNNFQFVGAFTANKLDLGRINLEEIFADRVERIYENYMDVSHVSDKVKRLAAEITKDCTTDYEKVKALEQYLRGYTYTQTPPVCPEGEDLLEFFLFETKEGYCTYFATALSLMARSVGVPTRYVQGFMVTTENVYPALSNYAYKCEVRDNQAHAWVEAYIEGIGFISLEPTPDYAEYRENTWESETIQPVVKPDINTTLEKVESDIEQEESETGKKIGTILLVTMGVILLTVILALIIYVVVKIVGYNMAYKRADNKKKMYMDMVFILNMTRELAFAIKPHETINEFVKRLSEYYETMEGPLKKMGLIYTKLRYDEGDVSEDDMMYFGQVRDFFKMEVRETIGIRKYIFNCYCKM